MNVRITVIPSRNVTLLDVTLLGAAEPAELQERVSCHSISFINAEFSSQPRYACN